MLAPIPGRELVDVPGGTVRQARQHVGKPSLRVDVDELGRCDQRADGGGPAPLVGVCEGPVRRSIGTARGSRSAALLNMHSRPSSKKRVSASQRLRL